MRSIPSRELASVDVAGPVCGAVLLQARPHRCVEDRYASQTASYRQQQSSVWCERCASASRRRCSLPQTEIAMSVLHDTVPNYGVTYNLKVELTSVREPFDASGRSVRCACQVPLRLRWLYVFWCSPSPSTISSTAASSSEEEGLHFRPSSSHCGCFRDQRAVPAYGNGCLPGEVSDGCSTVKRSYVYSRLIFVGTLCTFCQRRNCCAWLRRQRTLQCTDSAVDPFGMQCRNEREKSLYVPDIQFFTPHAEHWEDRDCFREPVSGARFQNFWLCSFYKVEDLASFPSDESMSLLSIADIRGAPRPLKTIRLSSHLRARKLSAARVFFMSIRPC